MYLEFYNLSDEPFRVTPDPDFLFLADQYKEALAAIIYGIAKRKGFICITGEVGVGKTTILRSYLSSVEDQGLTFVYIFNPKVTFGVLMRTILRDLGQATDGDVPEQVERLHEHLIACYRDNRTVVLFVDEAQNMPVETLENLRMLSNLETTTDKLLQIVLVGQQELDEILARPELRQLRSRIVVRAQLKPLGRADSLAYIRHRLSRVTSDPAPVFTASALDLIVKEAGGVPRLINILCDAALITGFGYRRRPIPPQVVREVVRDTLGRHPPRWRLWLAGGSVAALLALSAAGGWWGWRQGLILHNDPIGHLIEKLETTAAPPRPAAAPVAQAPAAHTPPPAAKAKPAASDPWGTAEEGSEPGSDLLRQSNPGTTADKEPLLSAPMPPALPPAAAASAAAPSSAATPPPTTTPPTTTTPAAKPMDAGAPKVQRVVTLRRGDTLSKLSRQIYGTLTDQTLGMVQKTNPTITNPNKVLAGQVVTFPALTHGSDPQEAALRKEE